jgi:hypothetical protein
MPFPEEGEIGRIGDRIGAQKWTNVTWELIPKVGTNCDGLITRTQFQEIPLHFLK